jgi:hypothetical protein
MKYCTWWSVRSTADKSRQEQTRADKSRQEQTRADKSRQEQTRADRSRREQTLDLVDEVLHVVVGEVVVAADDALQIRVHQVLGVTMVLEWCYNGVRMVFE